MSPEDVAEFTGVSDMTAALVVLLSTDFCVDWWEGDEKAFNDHTGWFIRPRISKDHRIMSPSWGGPCKFLRSDGCELEPSRRPAQCRLLEPQPGGFGHCVMHGESSKREYALLWTPYHVNIQDAINSLERS